MRWRAAARSAAHAGLAAGAGLASAAAADAAEHVRRSLYTTVDLAACIRSDLEPGKNVRRCRGLPGYPVYVAEAGKRYFLAVGEKPQLRKAARQSLKSPNSPLEGQSSRLTIEWRALRGPAGRPAPYATIVRYVTGGDEAARGEVLVVMRVSPSVACHVAYIDALANADAIALARRIADERAAGFDCTQEPEVIGARGNSPL